ncbi:MAG: FtsQ-type POTRA domain-containing protein [Sideroxydans sp.]|nr:FtsQ-type POTRA domain-containing protein [Sideroxydans sp.]
MWDDPLALRKLSNALFGIAAALLLFVTLDYALHLPVFALRAVRLSAPPQRVPEKLIAQVVHNELHGNFFTVDLAEAQHGFEQLPWVRKASVRRHFPWQLDVDLEEQVALAHWNGTQLVNTHGEVFAAEDEQALPSLIGPDDAAAEVAQRYIRFGEMLAPIKQQVAQLSLSPRGAWQLRLQDGMVVELGREQMEQRLARFVAVYPYSLATMPQPVRYVDLRYRNGFAAYLPAAHGRG